jgi:Tfp pilus assembly protein PilF
MHKISQIIGLQCLLLLLLFVFGPGSASAGTFRGLEPGVSTKSEVDAKLGKPIKEAVKGERYDYDPGEPDTSRISMTFSGKNQVIETIDIYSREPYLKSHYKEWFQLGNPDRSEHDLLGNRVESYASAGIMLHFSGPSDASPVVCFSHYDPAAETSGAKAADVYVDEINKAVKAADFAQAKRLLEEAFQAYPDSAALWVTRAWYYLKANTEPAEIRPAEIQKSMERAYRLEPSGKNAADLGWVHVEVFKDCARALTYFEEAKQKGHAEKDPALLYWMGHCYEQTGQIGKAKACFGRFLEAAPNHEFAPEAGERLQSQSVIRPTLPAALDLSSATETWAREWTVTASALAIANDGAFGFYENAGRRGDASPNSGRTGVLYVHPQQPNVPARIERHVALGHKPILRMGVSANRNADGNWDLLVKVDGRGIENRRTIEGRDGWQDLAYDLSAHANRTVTITIEVIPTGWHFEYAFFDYIEVL